MVRKSVAKASPPGSNVTPFGIFGGADTHGSSNNHTGGGGVVMGYLANIMNFMHGNISSLNNSKYFAGMVMIMLNLGAKVVSVNFSNSTQEYLKHGASKQLFIFSMSWMGTRDIYTSLVLTAVFTILSEHLFNEESAYCIVPKKYHMLVKEIDTNNDGVISESELQAALKVLEKAKKISVDGASAKAKTDSGSNATVVG